MKLTKTFAASLVLLMAHQVARGSGFEVRVAPSRAVRSGEPEVAVNPTHPDNIAFFAMKDRLPYARPGSRRWTEKGYMDCEMSVSLDRGRTWKERGNPFMTGRQTLCADPMVAFGPDGMLYAAADAMSIDPTNPKRWLLGEVEVARSSDGGITWSAPIISGTPFDRPFLVVDASDGTVYLSSSCIDPKASYCRAHIRYVLASRDRGLAWSERVRLDTPRYPSLGDGTISAAGGWLAVAYVSPTGSGCPCLVFGRTRNAGGSWNHVVVPRSQPISSLALVAADPARTDAYAIVTQSRDGQSYLAFVTRDGGKSWQGPAVIANTPRRVGFKPWVAFSPEGVLGLVWRAYDAPPAEVSLPKEPEGDVPPGRTFPYELWGAISRDGGVTFTRPLQLSGAPSPAAEPGQMAPDDESFVTLDEDDLHYAWGDWRGGNLCAWYGRTPLADFRPVAARRRGFAPARR